MNSYDSNRIERQHTPPLEIEQALRNDCAKDADKARRQRLALAHMATEQRLEELWPQWDSQRVWSPQTVRDIHQDLFARLPETDRTLPSTDPKGVPEALEPGTLRDKEGSVGRHSAPSAEQLPRFLKRWAHLYGGVRRGEKQVVTMAAAHHRLARIHPFRDGNGRVARLTRCRGRAACRCTRWTRQPDRAWAGTLDRLRAGNLQGPGDLHV
ncbi:MAG: Fic family protein [Hydrogenophaga sp.]